MIPDVPCLIPQPRRLRRTPGELVLPRRMRLPREDGLDPISAGTLESVLRKAPRPARRLPARESPTFEVRHTAVRFSSSGEAYRLVIHPEGIRIEGTSRAGVFYAVQTLAGLIRQYGLVLPCLRIEDFPEFGVRGFLHDVSRGKVPRRRTLFELVDLLASMKFNQLQLYIEHTFAFRRHPLPGRGHSPLRPEDIQALGAYCRERQIDLVPCLQSFGHATHFLKHARYAGLAESGFRGGWTFSPVDPGTYRLLKELYEDFLPSFPSGEVFNVCCDETWDLGKGRSASRASREGIDGVYLDHLKRVDRLARSHGRRAFFWADILEKYPDRVHELPRDTGLLYWNYEAAKGPEAVRGPLKRLRRESGRLAGSSGGAGIELHVCPGTSAWNSLFFRRRNAAANIFQMARAGRATGARGLLLTDWGDNGHYNFLSNSFWPLAWGAECAWNAPKQPRDETEFDEAFLMHVLNLKERNWLKAGRLLGNVHERFGVEVTNHSPERWLLTGSPPEDEDILGVRGMIEPFEGIRPGSLRRGLRDAESAAQALGRGQPGDGFPGLIRDEWLLSARLISFGCRRRLMEIGTPEPGDTGAALRKECRMLARRFEALWLRRNRESDLERVRKDFRRVERGLKNV